MKLTFYGGVKEVTGANYLLEHGKTKILIDCGLLQCGSFCEKKNWEPFPYDPLEIDAVFITHSHLDHIGLLPKLYKDGFLGKVFSTAPCRDFSEALLYDSQHILSLEAKRSRRRLLYEERDIEGLMHLWRRREYHQPIKIGDFTVTLYSAGHILGSSFILVEAGKKKVAFSGDLGNSPAPIIGDKDSLPEADYCLIESTYGDRIHEDVAERAGIVEDMIEDTVKSGGTLMIPAFAMERTQQLLFEIDKLIDNKRIPSIPVFLDSPLAIKITDVYEKYTKESLFDFSSLKKTLTTEQSKAIVDAPPPKVVIAGSGMMHGGRILYHLKQYLPDPKNALLIVGYQAEGSLGRRILNGAREVKIYDEMVPVRCRIKAIGGYSAHADQLQLLDWLRPQRQSLKKVFVVQGEEKPSSVLARQIQDTLAIAAEVPEVGKFYVL